MVEFEEARSTFTSSGFSVLRGVLNTEDLDRIYSATTALKKGAKIQSEQVLFTHTKPPKNSPPLSAIMNQWLNPHKLDGKGSTREVIQKVNDIASDFFGEPMQIYQDLILCKNEAHREFPWHQDAPFWPIDFSKAATFWIPLSEVNEFNGGLKFSQDYEAKKHAAVNLHTGVKQDGTPGFEPHEIYSPSLYPGDILVFSPTILHASGTRLGAEERIAHSSVFVDMDATWNHKIAPNHPRCQHTKHGSLVRD